MVYDHTDNKMPSINTGVIGYAIHEQVNNIDEPRFSIYTDDGYGNGDFICANDDVYWARRIARALDLVED